MWVGAATVPLLYFIGAVPLLPGFLAAATIEYLFVRFGPRSYSGVWDVIFLPVAVLLNVLIIWHTRRWYLARRSGRLR